MSEPPGFGSVAFCFPRAFCLLFSLPVSSAKRFLFPPVKIKNGVLEDKDSDPILYHEGSEIVMVTPDREVIPMLVNKDDSVRLPMPEEIEQLRAEGEVWQLPDPPPREAILGIDSYLANPNSSEPAMEQSSD